ncbi:hypothetical protein M5E87_28180 [Flavonifractor plautii]|nr:hypothetical protein M5E87_28180 [Flavonifractor plautii]
MLVLDNPGTLAEGMDASAYLTAADGTPSTPTRTESWSITSPPRSPPRPPARWSASACSTTAT